MNTNVMILPITIEPMQVKYNSQVSRLLVHVFRGKFQHLTTMSDDDLALFFEKLFEHLPTDPAHQRMIALQDGEVIGTISVKWRGEYDNRHKQKLSSWKNFNRFGKWNSLKMLIGLRLFNHKPEVGECYIADVVVHPDHQSKGVGKLLLQWALHFVQTEPTLDMLSLYVSGKNPRAKQLYEQLSFHTHSQSNSIVWHFFFNEMKWYYMVNNHKEVGDS
ncbi:GNAT family N-acetyltransferase [Paenibacillus sp. SC116]|uniref:GNAT family N-acetyltransferase n=1 Tax=Paenibacillus sp. SC116 TaxID=2968986 RepID=UPI00215A6281|nr:GNAT family N-acetyltransferase [Paenibacillus sp. SC116]MCR8842480.1 GNAT family N-acetyltransferase [Paenibacillus sp. SC116]